MSVSCWIAFADRVVTRMTVWSPYADDLDLGRALQLAHYAYESRMHRPPPERDITIAATGCRISSRCVTRPWMGRRTTSAKASWRRT